MLFQITHTVSKFVPSDFCLPKYTWYSFIHQLPRIVAANLLKFAVYLWNCEYSTFR